MRFRRLPAWLRRSAVQADEDQRALEAKLKAHLDRLTVLTDLLVEEIDMANAAGDEGDRR